MLLILAHRQDQTAGSLAERWKGHGARLLTCRDLSAPGWRYFADDPCASRAVVGGQVVAFDDIGGVLTRLPSVTEDDLPHIAPTDRSYVAAEATAFLIAWLSGASFPVVNRPTATCLMGPNWRREQWLHAAARAGMRVPQKALSIKPRGGETEPTSGTAATTLTVVGDRCFGRADASLAAQARALAYEAGVELLAVQFTSPEADAAFVGAYLGPDVSQPEVADALLAHLLAGAALAR